jgi:NAD(P)-dependent dehydrogenase (short-subunit alcohol dehydrogenase family)
MSQAFAGRVAMITGASSGIGKAAALQFAAAGARVALGARRADLCEETVREIEQRGGEALFLVTDVALAADARRLADAAAEHWGRLDFAINNAAFEGTSDVALADYDEQTFDRVIAVNLKGVFLAMKYAIPHMLKQGGGSIVNVSSVAGLVGARHLSAYVASKHGVIGLTKAAAIEYASAGIRVNAICPGVIQTAMADRIFAKRDPARVADLHPLGRVGTPEEIADAVLWLCSEKSSFVTGAALPVDGGFTAR